MTQRSPRTDLSAQAAAKRLSELKASNDAAKKATGVRTAYRAANSSAAKPTQPAKSQPKELNIIATRKANTPSPKRINTQINWRILIPAALIIILVLAFVFTSRAGLIRTFLTPADKVMKNNPAEETSTEIQTTSQAETTTEETTTEKTTPIDENASYYVIKVNLAYNVVTVYERGERLGPGYDEDDPKDDDYELTPVIAFTCSTGVDAATPEGTYYIENRSAWCEMIGDVWSRYATRIHDDIMFHSVPYYSDDPGDLEVSEYNLLGYDASAGCIRLNCQDAYWIYCNADDGTEVQILYDWSEASPIDTRTIYRSPTDIPQLYGWDPTDFVTEGNPWLSYTAKLKNYDVVLPYGATVDDLLIELGPTDNYGNNLSEYFWTDGGYNLWEYGTYSTVGHFTIANLEFSYDITITVSDSYWDNHTPANNYDDTDDDNNSDDDDNSDDDNVSDDDNSSDDNDDNNGYEDTNYEESNDDDNNDDYSEETTEWDGVYRDFGGPDYEDWDNY